MSLAQGLLSVARVYSSSFLGTCRAQIQQLNFLIEGCTHTPQRADCDTWTDADARRAQRGWSTNMSDGGPNSVPVGPPHQGCSGAALGQLWASKQRRTRRLYGFTDLRGHLINRGGCGHGSANQNVAGIRKTLHNTQLLNTLRMTYIALMTCMSAP